MVDNCTCSFVKIAKSPLVAGLPLTPFSVRINPPARGRITALPPLTAMKFTVLYENTASRLLLLVFLNEYSRAATGRLELSASAGIKGLQAFIETSSGTSGSARSISA
jgi:hypothetical protein